MSASDDKLRDGRFIAVANMKGGVGKTTTVVSLAETLAADEPDTAVLVVDLDPQASASICLAGDDALSDMIEGGLTLQDFLELRLSSEKAKRSLDDFIRPRQGRTLHRNQLLDISLLPCGPKLRVFEREMITAYARQNFGMKALEGNLSRLFTAYFAPLRRRYDFVVFDCPPGISPFTEVAIKNSDITIVPTIPDKISNYGLQAFCEHVWQPSKDGLTKPYVLATRVQGTTQHNDMLKRFEQETQEDDPTFRLFRTRMPQAARMADALTIERDETFTRKYGDALVQRLNALAAEIKEALYAG